MKWCVLALIMLFAVPASAHELPGSTATVVLRDGLVTIDANLDIAGWVAAQRVPKPQTLPALVASARKEAEALTVLVDGKPVVMSLVEFPAVDSVHAELQRPADKDHGTHARLVRVQWRAIRAVPKAASVVVRFPPAVGDVLVTFVEPTSKFVKAGGDAGFKSRRAHPATETK